MLLTPYNDTIAILTIALTFAFYAGGSMAGFLESPKLKAFLFKAGLFINLVGVFLVFFREI